MCKGQQSPPALLLEADWELTNVKSPKKTFSDADIQKGLAASFPPELRPRRVRMVPGAGITEIPAGGYTSLRPDVAADRAYSAYWLMHNRRYRAPG